MNLTVANRFLLIFEGVPIQVDAVFLDSQMSGITAGGIANLLDIINQIKTAIDIRCGRNSAFD